MDTTLGREESTTSEHTSAQLQVSALAIEVTAAASVFVLALTVYLLTLSPGLTYQSPDSNELIGVPYELGLAHSPGYPLYTWLGKAFTLLPVSDVAYRINLMSAFSAAAGCALLVGVILLLVRGGMASAGTDRRIELAAAVFGGLLFAFSATLWSQAVIAEVYAPNTLMLAATFLLLLLWARREEQAVRDGPQALYQSDPRSLLLFAAFALVFGLSTGTHTSNLALAVGFVPFILLTNWRTLFQPKLILLGAAMFALGVTQYAWLPFRATNVTDALLPRSAPTDLEGIYNYTLNAFSNWRWAFPIEDLPERVVMYLKLLSQNFSNPGIALAIGGAVLMLFRHIKAFFLLMGAYLFEVVFFLEYRASDIDVFFITSHFIVALFAAFGFFGLLQLVAALWQKSPGLLGHARLGPLLRRNGVLEAVLVIAGIALLVVTIQPARSLQANWTDNDESDNTGIVDFYRIVYDTLPEGAILMGQSGVFGYDMFYLPIVEGVRPDITIPAMTGNTGSRLPAGAPIYSTGTGSRGGGGPRSTAGLPQDAWYVPVVASPVLSETDSFGFANRTLTLYEATTTAPELFVTSPSFDVRTDLDLGDITLVGYDIDSSNTEAGGTVHLKLYWQGNVGGRQQIATKVGDTKYIERHDLGFGLVARYQQQNRTIPSGSYLVEEYDLVILSSTDGGAQPLQIAIFTTTGDVEWFEIGTLNVSR